MNSPTVSVIIPAYNNAAFLGATIHSVLRQSYERFEVVVVNDASPDDVAGVVAACGDPRVRYLAHDVNRGLSAARNTAIRASHGEILALLDGDDLFEPRKLEAHVEFLLRHPEIGCTYNARFELDHSADTIRDLWRPPRTVELTDLAAGFPFSPSDTVVRREWANRAGLFDERYVYVGEDLDFNCRLALEGCRFARVDGVLNSRRYHAGRVVADVRWLVDKTLEALDGILSDPRCPAAVAATRERLIAMHLLQSCPLAFSQNETQAGREYCLGAVRRCPEFVAGDPSPLVDALVGYSIMDRTAGHESLLRRMLAQLPPELAISAAQGERAVARASLRLAVRTALWHDAIDPGRLFDRAAELGARIDTGLLQSMAAWIIDYAAARGEAAAASAVARLSGAMRRLATPQHLRSLHARVAAGMAFAEYADGRYAAVPGHVLRALVRNPEYLANRGMLSIFVRSLARTTGNVQGLSRPRDRSSLCG